MKVKPWTRAFRVLVVLVLAAAGATAGAVPAYAGSMVVYNSAPAAGSVVIGPGCTNVHQYTYGFSGNWQSTGSGDYTGSGVYGQSNSRNCTGTTDYILDQATQSAQFRWHLETFCATGCTSVPCKIWAYIPTTDAGDFHARYDFWADDGNGNLTWLAWPGGNVDQEDNSGWTYLGQVTVGNTHILTVSLNNQDAAKPGWYSGAGDIAVNCPAQQVIPTVPTSLETTSTDTLNPALSGVVASPAGGMVKGEIFLEDAAGNPLGGAPTAIGTVDSGERVSYQVPDGVLTAGATYQWYLESCQQVCSAPTATQTFTISAAPPTAGTVTTTLSSSAITAMTAQVTPGTCGGQDCPVTSGTTLNVGNDGTSVWRSGLKIDLSAIPADALITGATLTLHQAACLHGCAAANTVEAFPADSDVASQVTGPELAAAADPQQLFSGSITGGSYDIGGAVQTWSNGLAAADGLVLQAADESSNGEAVSYYSPAAADPAQRPSVTVTYLPPSAPDAPVSTQVVAGDGGALLSWAPPANPGDSGGVTSYLAQALDPSGLVAAQVTTTDTHAMLTGLTDGTAYTVQVAAINAVGTGPYAAVQAAPQAVPGGSAQYTQAVEQFAAAREALLDGTDSSASDAAAAASQGPEFAAALQAESGNDVLESAAMSSQDMSTSGDADAFSNTLVSVSPDGDTVTVFTTDDHTYTTSSGVSTGNPDSTPGESITDLEFTFNVGTTPQLTGYADEDAELPTADGVASDNATSTSFADDPGAAGLTPPSIATSATGFTSGSEQIASLAYANGNGTAQWAYNHIGKAPQAGFSKNFDCADFASQSLYYGGGERQLSDPWDFYRGHDNMSLWWYTTPLLHGLIAPSHTWGDARYLATFLDNKGSTFIRYAIDAKPGDLIFVNWNGVGGFGGIDHVGVVYKIDRFGEIYISQHSPPVSTLPLSTWEQSDPSGNPTPGHWNPKLILWIIRPRAW